MRRLSGGFDQVHGEPRKLGSSVPPSRGTPTARRPETNCPDNAVALGSRVRNSPVEHRGDRNGWANHPRKFRGKGRPSARCDLTNPGWKAKADARPAQRWWRTRAMDTLASAASKAKAKPLPFCSPDQRARSGWTPFRVKGAPATKSTLPEAASRDSSRSRVRFHGEMALTRGTRDHPEGVLGLVQAATPAAWTIPAKGRPARMRTTPAARAVTEAASARSAGSIREPWHQREVSSSRNRLLEVKITSAPDEARATANARPTPLPAPVTSHTGRFNSSPVSSTGQRDPGTDLPFPRVGSGTSPSPSSIRKPSRPEAL